MTISLSFGYGSRHNIYYNHVIKSGSISLWSGYSGSGAALDATGSKGGLTEVLASQISKRGVLFGVNGQTEFQIGDEEDVLSMLAALELAISGKEPVFSNYVDRKISFSCKKQSDGKEAIILVKIGSNEKTGNLTIKEARELVIILKDILHDFGYSNAETTERLADKKLNL